LWNLTTWYLAVIGSGNVAECGALGPPSELLGALQYGYTYLVNEYAANRGQRDA